MSSEQLLSATLIEDPTFVEDFLKNYPSHKGKLLHLPSSRSYKPPFPTQLATPLDLLTLVRVALAPEPQLYLSAEETTAKQILLALNAISGGKIFELPIRYSSYNSGRSIGKNLIKIYCGLAMLRSISLRSGWPVPSKRPFSAITSPLKTDSARQGH